MPHVVKGERYYLKQKVNFLEAIASTAGFGCCEQKNIYAIIDEKGDIAYTALEQSNCLCRCCCAPYHKFQLNVYEGKVEDVKSADQVMTMFHPFKCPACCPICFDFCRGEMIVYDGPVNAYDNDETGEVISHAKQPVCGGGLTPTIQVWEGEANDEKDPDYSIKGPCCCIGGICGELICVPTFNILTGHGKDEKEQKEPLAEIKKDKPAGFGDAAKQLFTDADNFTINMPPGASGKTKSAILASGLLIDYLFFEEDGNIFCDPVAQQLKCNCTNFYCCGAICPCYLVLDFSNKEGN
mmetsp:Transcript_10906/g.16267  ORF Transcript_10906/g.16267 Transcript_10906/m.16267 type:complete len:296 (-) Transcript_10906:93-980(-)